MANTSAGRQQVTNHFGKELRSIYANQEQFGLLKPGAYNVKASVTGGGTQQAVTIKKDTCLVFQSTFEEFINEEVRFLTKVVLESDYTFTSEITTNINDTYILLAQWSYSTDQANRFAQFRFEVLNEYSLVPDTEEKVVAIPLAIVKWDGSNYLSSYFDVSDKLNFYEDLYDATDPVKGPFVIGENSIALLRGNFFADSVYGKSFWVNSDGEAALSIARHTLSTLNLTAINYEPIDSVGYSTNRDLSSLNIPPSQDLENNYGYTWTSLPTNGAGLNEVQVDVLILSPTLLSEIDSSKKLMTSRPKLRVITKVFTDSNITLPGEAESYDERQKKLMDSISNKTLDTKSGIPVCAVFRPYNVTKVFPRNVLKLSNLKNTSMSSKMDRIELPILAQ